MKRKAIFIFLLMILIGCTTKSVTEIYKVDDKILKIKGTLIEDNKIKIEINGQTIIEEDINLTANKPFDLMSGYYEQKLILATCRYDDTSTPITSCTISLDSKEISELVFK